MIESLLRLTSGSKTHAISWGLLAYIAVCAINGTECSIEVIAALLGAGNITDRMGTKSEADRVIQSVGGGVSASASPETTSP